MIKKLLDQLEINVLNVELYTVGTEWRHTNVISPYSRLYYITKGQGFITQNKTRYLIEPGFMYLLPAFTRVDLFCPKSFTHYYIHFTTELPDGHNLFSIFDYSTKLNASEQGIEKNIFERLIQLNPGMELIERDANKPIYRSLLERHEMLNRDKTARSIIETNALMRLLIAPFIRIAGNESLNPRTGINRFEKVIKYINENISQPFSLKELARLANLNPSYFSSLFTKHMGISPIRYVNTKKVENAQRLLLSTTKTLDEIAYAAGFDDVFYFSRIFKKITGLPPALYRKQQQYI
ncbi:Arabinose operon regulatory protein [Limihaloglobus sulfuriphilus]|uniref:Arabinose operon regulatory protein n=1 Tax=Limihaloglobus sulfuriphilus TaxID=1851148 RepID=A0A1Q2MCU6_9BACT|nr:AraC family transcriptional regulator [Limihaloglobus sulfuriphilus]AQQ70072.1 Arabinose operon regulatory protein [Limihaloglobus sulfuriphilus]